MKTWRKRIWEMDQKREREEGDLRRIQEHSTSASLKHTPSLIVRVLSLSCGACLVMCFSFSYRPMFMTCVQMHAQAIINACVKSKWSHFIDTCLQKVHFPVNMKKKKTRSILNWKALCLKWFLQNSWIIEMNEEMEAKWTNMSDLWN